MPSAHAEISTSRASRYLTQLCKHAAAMGSRHRPGMHGATGMPARRGVDVRAEYSDSHGVLTFTPWGSCTLTATATTLTLRIDAADEQSLHTIQDILTSDLHRMGRRAGLSVSWQPAAPSAGPANTTQENR